jgi:hypothetical protein
MSRADAPELSCYDYFNDHGMLKDDIVRLQLLFRLLGIVLLYTDYQIYTAKGQEARSDAIEKLIRLVGSAFASGMPQDPQYRLKALLAPYVEIDGINIQTSAYLVGMVQEVFQKYAIRLTTPNGLDEAIKDFSRETTETFVGLFQQDPLGPFGFQMLLMTALGSLRLKEVLS